MDLFPTIMKLAGVPLPPDVIFDGVDISPLLTGEKESVRDEVFYYTRDQLYAVRKGEWKAHFITKRSYSKEPPVEHDVPVLFNIEHDPSEKYDVATEHPEIISEIRKVRDQHRSTLTPVVSHLDGGYKKE
jgi:arylsulfatase A